MSKKTVRDIIKGVAITGAAVSGASILGDANLVYAQTAEELAAQDQLVLPLETSEAGSESTVENAMISEVQLDDIELYASTSTSISEEDVAILSTSESTSESQEITSNSMQAEITSVEEEAAAESAAYASKGYDNAGLDAQEEIVTKQMDKVEHRLEEIRDDYGHYTDDNGKDQIGNDQLGSNNFYNESMARGLAVEMVKYKLLLDGVVDEANVSNVKVSDWSKGNYENKYVCIQYIDVNQDYHEDYFDYVTADKEGNSLFQWEVGKINITYRGNRTAYINGEDYAEKVYGINVVKKVVEFSTKVKNGTYELLFTNDKGETTTVTGDRYRMTLKADSNGHYKGDEYYKSVDYKANIKEREQMATEITSLSSKAEGLQSELADYVATTSEANNLWNLHSMVRAESLSISAENSTSASEYKSLSTSESTVNSLSSSESVSESESTSAAASETAAAQVAAVATEEESASVAATVASGFASYSAPAATPVATQTFDDNEGPTVTIVDNYVPLAVVDAEEVEQVEANTPAEIVVESKTRVIDDEEVAKAGTRTVNMFSRYLLLFLAIIAGIFGLRKVEKDLREKI